MKNSKESQIIVLGAGGHGKSVVSVMQASGFSVFGILDDNPEVWDKEILGVPVLGPVRIIEEYSEHGVVMGFGDNKIRRQVANMYQSLNWIIVRSPLAYVNPTVKIGTGTIIFPFAVIGAEVSLGEHVIASANITIGHDTIIEDFVHVAPGVQIAGASYVEKGAMLGMSSVICPEVRIGEDAILGAGAVAVKDIPANSVAYGVPAKVQSKS